MAGIPDNAPGWVARVPGHYAILDALIFPVSLINDHYIYEWVNICYSAAHGKKSSEIIGKTVQAIWGQEVFYRYIKRDLDRCLEGREVREGAWVNFPALGRRYCEYIYSPYRPDGTSSMWAIVVSYDITDRKNADEQIESSERRFRSLSEASLEAIVFIENGIVVDANEALYKLFGYQKGEVLRKPAIDFIAPEWRENTIKRIKEGIQGSYETCGLRRDGTTFPIEVTAREFEEKGHRMRISAVRDLTRTKTNRRRIEGSPGAPGEACERAN